MQAARAIKTTAAVTAIAAAALLTACGGMSPMMSSYSQASLPDPVKVPTGHKVAWETVGVGDITYECRDKANAPGQVEWTFVGPKAALNDRMGKQVGTYYGPPATWEAMDGSKVTGLRYKDRNSDAHHEVDLEGVFVQIGLVPNTEWLKDSVALTPRGEIEVDYRGQTATLPVTPRDGMVGKPLTLGIRPEHIQIGSGDISLTVTPSVIERLGANTVAYAALGSETENFCAMLPGSVGIRTDVPVAVGINAADCHLFDEEGIAFERRVELTDIDMNLLAPATA